MQFQDWFKLLKILYCMEMEIALSLSPYIYNIYIYIYTVLDDKKTLKPWIFLPVSGNLSRVQDPHLGSPTHWSQLAPDGFGSGF